MANERTKRFERLLAMQQQLEKQAEWRLAAACAERIASEERRRSAVLAAEEELDRRKVLVSEEFQPASLRSAIAAEGLAEVRVQDAATRLKSAMEMEQNVRVVLRALQQKTRQWEKVTEASRVNDEQAEVHAQQIAWDEHGLRGRAGPVWNHESGVGGDATGGAESR